MIRFSKSFLSLSSQLPEVIFADVSSGAKLRIKARGIERGPDKGDQYVIMKVMVPKTLTEDAKDLLRKIETDNPINARADIQW